MKSRGRSALSLVALTALTALGCGSSSSASNGDGGGANDAGPALPRWLSSARVVVSGHDADDPYRDCRTVICRHNENTDLTTFKGAIYFVHRTAISQTLGPNSALHVYRSTDGGKSFTETARIEAPVDRDVRDPHFYEVNGELFLKALTRLAVASARDSNVDTVTVAAHSPDGAAWTPLAQIGPHGWSFWRIRENNGVYYSAAYQDGDKSVVLYSSTDGLSWNASTGAPLYAVSADTPLETELTFMPNGKLLALVRTDGTDDELLGDVGRLRTKVCWASPPYASFDCSTELAGQRLDGPLTFFDSARTRLFVVARKHLQGTGKKRTALFEITGDAVVSGGASGGALSIKEWGELPSAGDTSYAGVAMIDPSHALVRWYSGDLTADRPWVLAMFDLTDVWHGVIDLGKL